MHYLTLQKIYNNNKIENEKNLIKKLDNYLFKLKNKDQIINPVTLYTEFNLTHNEQQFILYILRLANKLGMFKLILEAHCKRDRIRIDYADENDFFVECCPYCEQTYTIKKEDFIVSFQLVEQPLYKTFLSSLFKKSA